MIARFCLSPQDARILVHRGVYELRDFVIEVPAGHCLKFEFVSPDCLHALI